MGTNSSPARWLAVVLCGIVCLGAAVPTIALWQDKPAANSDKQKKTEEERKNRSQKPKRDEKDKTRSETQARPAATPGVRVVPMNPGQAAPGQPQTGPGARPAPGGIRIERGPDGRPTVIGPDGRAVAPGPGGQAVIGAPQTPPGGPPPPGGGQTFSPSPGGMISMDFRGADINNVLKFFAMATGWQIVPDPGLSGPVTIVSPRQLTTDQAFEVLQSVLEVRGFSGQLEQRGKTPTSNGTTVLKIVPLDRAVQSTRLLANNGNLTSVNLRNQVVTQVIPIENVDAGALSRELKELINKGASLVASAGTNALIITDTAANVDRITDLVGMLDKAASNTEVKMIPLKHADATSVVEAINNLFGKVFSRGRAAPAQAQPGQPQPQPQPGRGGQPGGAASETREAVVATADTRTNSVLVVASASNMEKVEALIKQLDDPNASALDTYIRKLQFADAAEIADIINSILSGATPSTRPGQGASFQQRVFGGGGQGFPGGGGGQQPGSVQSTDPFAKVVANLRTNSLIITATKERLARIDELIKELDVEVKTETTTFVIPLKNAQAQDVAYILGQAFGTGQQQGGGFGGFGFFGGFGGGGQQQRQRIQRRQGQQQRNTGFGRSADVGQDGTQTVVNGVKGTMTPQGFIPDPVQPADEEDDPSRQFFFDGFGGRQRGNQMPTPLYGRGGQGSFVNLLQLRNNVGVVPDLGSNSLIITTTPDNMIALREIIAQLDIVPRQVMIEVVIAEATLDATQKLGFQFDVAGVGRILGTDINHSGASNFPLGAGGNASGNIASPLNPGAQFGVQALNGKFNALVQAIATDDRFRVLSTPKIFTSNNQEAEILVVTNVPYVANQFTSGFGSSNAVQFLQVGITLNVTPRITTDGLVTIDVVSTASDLLAFDVVSSGLDGNGRRVDQLAPRTTERTTDTSVSVRDGEIVALGGLMRDSTIKQVSKVPLLGDIPLIGHLFRSTRNTTTKTELMLFMIPHVIEGDAQNRGMVNEQSKSILKQFPNLKNQQPALDPVKDRPLHNPNPQGDRPKGP